jgi:hypothetical protein
MKPIAAHSAWFSSSSPRRPSTRTWRSPVEVGLTSVCVTVISAATAFRSSSFSMGPSGGVALLAPHVRPSARTRHQVFFGRMSLPTWLK